MNNPVVIIGSGIAGLNFALSVSEHRDVVILTKNKIDEGCTKYAQGGIAAVLGASDNFESHVQDTLKAGSYHNDESMVRFMVEKGPEAVSMLTGYGIELDKEGQDIALTLEGGHSMNRVAHKGDHTGKEIENGLIKSLSSKATIEILEDSFAVDLEVHNEKVHGVHFLHNGVFQYISSRDVVIATGGIGQLYKFTSNPSVSTGDGIAMAHRAGAEMCDMEFVQFHPTVFESGFLLSEALRGEGALLLNSTHKRFVDELLPRDKVSLAIYNELKNGQVYLDFRHEKEAIIKKRFPSIFKELHRFDLNLAKDLIPVQPAAHYLCGGIKIDKNGRTNIDGLYAFGECAYTGVHGANRLASNSLLEAAVFSMQVADELKIVNHNSIINVKSLEIQKTEVFTEELRDLMWSKVGVVRTLEGLNECLDKLKEFNDEAISGDVTHLEFRNMVTVSKLVCESALKRPKSLGCHVIV
jgi:L-aspartate oxidase